MKQWPVNALRNKITVNDYTKLTGIGTQNPVVVIPYRFDPDQRHHTRSKLFRLLLFYAGVYDTSISNTFLTQNQNNCCIAIGLGNRMGNGRLIH